MRAHVRAGCCVVAAAVLAATAAGAEPPTATADAAAEVAQAAQARGDDDAARAAAERALALDPRHPLALRILAALDREPPVGLDNAVPAVRREAAGATLAAACDDAAFLLQAGRPRAAGARLDGALAAHGTDANAEVVARARRLRQLALEAETEADTAGAARDRGEAAALARDHSAANASTDRSLRAERLARISDLRLRGHRELALAHCRALLRDLPGDEEADTLFRDLLDETHTARRTAIDQRERELRAEIALLVERSLIPEGFDGQPVYPSDWQARHNRVAGVLDVAERGPAWMEAIADRLGERVTVAFEAEPVADAINLVARLGGLSIVIAPELLASADSIVSLRATGMRLEDVLTWICEQAGTRWAIVDGGIFVGERVETGRRTAIHDVGELVVGTGDFPGPALQLGADTAGGAGFLAADTGVQAPTADDIADLIRRTVSPRSWDEDGNGIVVRGSILLVTAPESIQRLIREFLRAQSAQRSLSVRVDARWLEMSDRYVEEIGVQWASGPGTLIDPGATMRRGLIRRLDGWAIDGGTTNDLPASAMSVQPPVAGSGLTLHGALLGGTQLSAVLSAVERNAQGRVLQAPELVCLNGQQAHAFFGQQAAYISDYEISGGAYDPVISTLTLGALLEVRPLVSADRRYITLELRTALTSATFFTETIIGIDTNSLVPAAYPIELPNVAVRSAGSSVMLPDRGSLLVGGFNSSLDQFSATRVPLLGSVPFLGRLFGARGRYADRSKLYLLTTATIINYPELEARL